MQIQANLENYNTFRAENCFPRYTILVNGNPILINHSNMKGRLVRTIDQFAYANIRIASALILNSLASNFGNIFRISQKDAGDLADIRRDNLNITFPFELVVYLAISRSGRQIVAAKTSTIYNSGIITMQEIQTLKSIQPNLTAIQCKKILANTSFTLQV